MKYKIEGTLKQKMNVREFGKNNTPVQTIVIDIKQKFDSLIPIDFIGSDKVEMLESISEGQDVAVEFYVGGREWQGKYFVSLKGQDIQFEKPMVNKDLPF
jgi:predicted membrane GTPase involved in stress response